MDLLALEAQHLGDRWAADVDVQQPDLGTRGVVVGAGRRRAGRGGAGEIRAGPAGAQLLTSRSRAARAKDSCAEKVLLPTPPLPDSTSTMCFTPARRSVMAATSGSGPLAAPDAHTFWLGQPAHEAAAPALSLSVPGQSAAHGHVM